MALVTLEITLVSGGEDDSASLLYLPDGGGEPQHYTDFFRGGMCSQQSFVGHSWVVRGKTTGRDLLRIEAQAQPDTQTFRIDLDGEEANFLRPGRRRGERPTAAAAAATARPARAAEDGDDGNAADDADRHPDVVGEDGAQPQAERADGGSEGSWVSADGICTFQRLPSAGGGGGDGRAVLWRELDLDGRVAGTLEQVTARVDTRWLWWLRGAYAKLAALPHDKEYLLMCGLTLMSAYKLDLQLPVWMSGAMGGRLGPNPLMMILTVACVAGAVVAAAIPLTDTTIELYNRQTRQSVRLSDKRGFTREPGHDPQRPRAWVPVCDGAWGVLPDDLRELRGQRTHHGLLVAAVVAWVASWAAGRAA
jgi:hypothetical protein